MRDLSHPYRLAVFEALDGNISVPIFDEKKKVGNTDPVFAILSTQQQVPNNENDCTWMSRVSIDIEITQKTGFEVTKNVIDGISNEILTILLPDPWVTGITSAGVLYQNAYCESIISRNVSLSESETVIQKIIRFVCTAIEQM